jgi:hypothetical protein
LEPKGEADESVAYSAAGKSATARAKSATRTVVADIERTMLDVAEVTVDLLGGKTTEPTEDRSAETAPAKTDDVVALQAKPAAPTPAKKAAKDAGKAKATAKRPVGVESVSFESVATESSPVVSSPAEVPVVLAIDPAVESAASGAVVPTDKPSVEPTPAGRRMSWKEIEVPDALHAAAGAARQAGSAEVPRFCYHERLSIAGNCRMCLVEVKGGPPKPRLLRHAGARSAPRPERRAAGNPPTRRWSRRPAKA